MRRTAVVFAALLVGGLSAVTAWSPAPASGQGAFTAVASADGIRSTVVSRNLLLVEEFADAGAPSAQALISSIGQSDAFAAYPYPGKTALAGAGIAHQTYPLMASTSFEGGNYDAAVDAGYYSLKANSVETASSATATGGSGSDQASSGLTRSHAEVTDEKEISGTGESNSEGMTFGTVLYVGRVHAKAHAVLNGEATSLSSEFQADDVRIVGQAVGFDQNGLVVPGTSQAIDPNLASALQSSGVTVKYLAPSTDDDKHGIVSAGMEVSVASGATGRGPSSVTYIIGRATARAIAAAEGAPAGGGGSTSGETGPSTDLGTAPSTGSGAVSSSAPSSTSSGLSTSSPATPATRTARGTAAARPGTARLIANQAPGFSSFSFYLVLVVAAVAALGAAQLIRILGVRWTWMS